MRYSVRWYLGQKPTKRHASSKWEIDQLNDKTAIGAETGKVYDHYDCNRMLHVVVCAENELEALWLAQIKFSVFLRAKKWRNDLGQL